MRGAGIAAVRLTAPRWTACGWMVGLWRTQELTAPTNQFVRQSVISRGKSCRRWWRDCCRGARTGPSGANVTALTHPGLMIGGRLAVPAPTLLPDRLSKTHPRRDAAMGLLEIILIVIIVMALFWRRVWLQPPSRLGCRAVGWTGTGGRDPSRHPAASGDLRTPTTCPARRHLPVATAGFGRVRPYNRRRPWCRFG